MSLASFRELNPRFRQLILKLIPYFGCKSRHAALDCCGRRVDETKAQDAGGMAAKSSGRLTPGDRSHGSLAEAPLRQHRPARSEPTTAVWRPRRPRDSPDILRAQRTAGVRSITIKVKDPGSTGGRPLPPAGGGPNFAETM